MKAQRSTPTAKFYSCLEEAGYMHEFVNHSESEWVSGECRINSCENRVSLLRPRLAVHRGASKENISLYPKQPSKRVEYQGG